MKPKPLPSILRPGGILRWSTLCILAGLTGCEERYVATEKDVEMAGLQKRIDKLDSQKQMLLNGAVPNNFHVPGVGYYHATVRDFFEYPYDHVKDGMHYIDGKWEYFSREPEVKISPPTAAALRRVEAALEDQEKAEDQNQGAVASQHRGGGFNTTDALLMYWMLSGNRGNFAPGNGFRQADERARTWQRDVEEKRNEVNNHASSSAGYRAVVSRSEANGTPVKAGQSVRGGFGSSRSGRSGGFYGG